MDASTTTPPVLGIAAAQVFARPDLLERVLLELPLCDVIPSQQVNYAFYTAVNTTPTIQEALFLHPASAPMVSWSPSSSRWVLKSGDGSMKPIANPFLARFVCSAPPGVHELAKASTLRLSHYSPQAPSVTVAFLELPISKNLPRQRRNNRLCGGTRIRPLWEKMTLTDLPLDGMIFFQKSSRSLKVLNPCKFRLGDLLNSLHLGGRRFKAEKTCQLIGPGAIAWLPGGVRGTTGWEALRVLEATGAKRSALLGEHNPSPVLLQAIEVAKRIAAILFLLSNAAFAVWVLSFAWKYLRGI
ncbi:uncharacterized protein LTR77_010568 [Saxophila tyrrhenica]|uniref:Uncharacterized protein n=1 Tax=Saxophila tyrrhenica TaxID=1690608 RepID=A0AAV9NVL6_9PEZI|nr:hypothetical protein LTR77_010568 [Saxophila tyrrhenica]